jgi:hypothetical protein
MAELEAEAKPRRIGGGGKGEGARQRWSDGFAVASSSARTGAARKEKGSEWSGELNRAGRGVQVL